MTSATIGASARHIAAAPAGRGGTRFVRGVFERLVLVGLGALNRLVPKHRTKVVVHSIPTLEDGVLTVVEAVAVLGYRTVVLVDGSEPRDTTVASLELVAKLSLPGLWHYLTAAYIVTTHGLFGDRPPPVGQQVINLWHGEPPVKPIGRFENEPSIAATVAPVSSAVGRAYRCAEFGLSPQQVPVLGAPRNDRMIRSNREAARRALLGGLSRPTFIWMPTFRATSHGRHSRIDSLAREPSVPFDRRALAELDTWLEAHGAMVVVKLHPLDAANFEGIYGAIKPLLEADLRSAGLSLYESLPAFDGLITDASSIWVDYLLLDRPIAVAFPDIEDYRATRGLNVEPYEDWVPGRLVTNISDLTEILGEWVRGEDSWAEWRRRTSRMLHLHHDDGSTSRLLDHLGIT